MYEPAFKSLTLKLDPHETVTLRSNKSLRVFEDMRRRPRCRLNVLKESLGRRSFQYNFREKFRRGRLLYCKSYFIDRELLNKVVNIHNIYH